MQSKRPSSLKILASIFVIMMVIFLALVAYNNHLDQKLAKLEEKKKMKDITSTETKEMQNSSKESVQTENQKLDSEEQILQFIQNYKGKDNSGPTFNEVLDSLLTAAYPGEDIANNPSTTGYFIASPDVSREISDRYWRVQLEIQTYREKIHYEWIVDIQTNEVFAANEMGQSFLDILDNFD